jgi:hypothetical protein
MVPYYVEWVYITISYRATGSGSREHIEKSVTSSLTALSVITTILIRLSFLLRPKLVSEFISKVRSIKPEVGWVAYTTIALYSVMSIISAAINNISMVDKWNEMGSNTTNSTAAESDALYSTNWDGDPTKIAYATGSFIFGVLPAELTDVVAFTFILTTTSYIRASFDTFCHVFQKEIELLDLKKKIIVRERSPGWEAGLTPNPNQKKSQVHPGMFVLLSELKPSWIQPNTNRPKKFLLQQLGALFDLFKLYDRIHGPLLVGICCNSGVTVIRTLDHMLVNSLTDLERLHLWTLTVHMLQVLYLLQVGFSFHQQVNRIEEPIVVKIA